MMMKQVRQGMVVLVFLGAAILFVGEARGSLIEFTFGGQLEQVIGSPPSPWDGVAVGSEFLVTYVFDTETPDQDPSLLNGFYAVESLSVSIDGAVLMAGAAEIDLRLFTFDHEYIVNFSDLSIDASGGIDLRGFFALDSDDLPANLDLNDWFSRSFAVVQNGGGYQIHGIVTTFSSRIVPTPGVPISMGVMVMSWRRRRRD